MLFWKDTEFVSILKTSPLLFHFNFDEIFSPIPTFRRASASIRLVIKEYHAI